MDQIMNRRDLLLGLALSLPLWPALAAEHDAVAVVRATYEASLQADRQRSPMSEERFLAPLSLQLRTLWRISRGNLSPTAPIGPKVHAHYGPGLLPGHPVTLARIDLESANAAQAVVAVALTVRGAPRLIRVELVREDETWRIANFRYPDDDYVSVLKRAMGQ
jgi:hypothetical protein